MKQYFLYLIIFLHLPLFTYINQHNNFNAILNYIDNTDHHPHTLVLLDIDNTLAQPRGTYLASDQWVGYHIKQKMSAGLSALQAWDEIKTLYFMLAPIIELMLVEEITASIIKDLQARGIIVVAITARSIEISDCTIAQLKSLGIDLTINALWDEEIVGQATFDYRYKDGIIFCDSNEKGTVLELIMKIINKPIKKVVVVDDKERHLHSIKKVLPPLVDFFGIRYGYLDHVVESFDIHQAEQDLQKYLITIQ